MKALIKTSNGERGLRFEENYPNPKVSYGKVKIKVKIAAICGSDVHFYYEPSSLDNSRFKYPVVIGHEGSGEIVEIGEGVEGLKIGNRVVSETTFNTCKHCENCYEGNYNLCDSREGLGSAVDGYFSEYVVVDQRSVHAIPEDISYQEASICEPLAVACHGIFEKCKLLAGETVAIIGPGPIGLLAGIVAKACGCVVVFIGRKNSNRLNRIKNEFDFYDVYEIDEDLKKKTLDLTDGRGFDVVIESSGSPSAFVNSIDVVKKGGNIICLGTSLKDVTVPYSSFAYEKDLSIYGVRSTTPKSWNKALRLLKYHIIDVNKVIDDIIPLKNWEYGYQKMHDKEVFKIAFNPELD